jgi:hypothetical protein
MGGVLTAAALGQSPLGWRRAVGERAPRPPSIWLLADFLDFAADENGATTKLTDTLFAKLLEEDAGDERKS